MFSMKLWMGLSLLVVSALAAPPVRVNGDKSVETPLAQDIRRFDGVVAIEPKPTSRNGIKRGAGTDQTGEKSSEDVLPKPSLAQSQTRDQQILRQIIGMRRYSEAAQLLLLKMVEKNETFGATVLAEEIVKTLQDADDYETTKDRIESGKFEPLVLIQSVTFRDTEGRTKESKATKEQWIDAIKSSLFIGFSKVASDSNIPWDNVLYEPDENLVGIDLAHQFARWELGFSLAQFLWSAKLRRRDSTVVDTAVNEMSERLEAMCFDEESRNLTMETISSLQLLGSNETLFSDLTQAGFSDEMLTGVLTLMQYISALGNAGETINPYTKGSEVYESLNRVLGFEKKKENLTENSDFFIRKFQKLIAFGSSEAKGMFKTISDDILAVIEPYFLTCGSLNQTKLREVVVQSVELFAKYTEVSKKYFTSV